MYSYLLYYKQLSKQTSAGKKETKMNVIISKTKYQVTETKTFKANGNIYTSHTIRKINKSGKLAKREKNLIQHNGEKVWWLSQKDYAGRAGLQKAVNPVFDDEMTANFFQKVAYVNY